MERDFLQETPLEWLGRVRFVLIVLPFKLFIRISCYKSFSAVQAYRAGKVRNLLKKNISVFIFLEIEL